MAPAPTRRAGEVPLARALSKLGVASRAQAIALILEGRVTVGGRVVRDPGHLVHPERARLALDGASLIRAPWTTVLLNKPRGVVTTRSDPGSRRTVYDLLGPIAVWIGPVGRLDAATSGLILLTNDTRLAAWLTDPVNAVPRRYAVTVRGRVDDDTLERLTSGILDRGERLRAREARIRKRSNRETHLVLVLVEGRNREVRRLCAAVGHEVTALVRVAFGGLALGTLRPGEWRVVDEDEIRRAFPGAPAR